MTKSFKERLEVIEGQSIEAEAIRERQYPAGWQPGVVWEGTEGTLTTSAVTEAAIGNWDEWLIRYGLDPEVHYVVEDTVRFTAWDGWRRDQEDERAYSCVQYSFRAAIKLKANIQDEDWVAVYDSIRRAQPVKTSHNPGKSTLVVALSDWQIGNPDGGGVEAQIGAIDALVQKLPDHISDMKKLGHSIDEILVAGMGDLGENCTGFYEYQQATVELNRRQQTRVVRRGLRDLILAVHPHAPKVTVTAVGGNHGENRGSKNKAQTGPDDNDDVAVFEALAEGFTMNPAFDNIHWKIPNERLAVSHRVGNQIVAFTHGHLARAAGGNAAQSMWNWWTKHAMGRYYEGVADADILISGHFHHFNVKEQEGRLVVVCPSLTRVGDYFGNGAGVSTRPGTTTIMVHPDGWSNLEIL